MSGIPVQDQIEGPSGKLALNDAGLYLHGNRVITVFRMKMGGSVTFVLHVDYDA